MDFINQFQGYFLGDYCWAYALASVVVLLFLGFFSQPLIVWSIAILAIMFGFAAPVWLLGLTFVVLLVFNLKPIRTAVLSSPIMNFMIKMKFIPQISATEKSALDAGVVWVEKDLFSGKPDFDKILQEPYAQLTDEEKKFCDHQVNELCRLIDPWKIYKTREINKEVWDYIKKEKFLGMIIPKEYGGLGFTAMAHSEVIAKISTRSIPVGVTVMVPNSLGPAELLIHYGTDKQKDYYLPRLASGDEIPCFGLTEPNAGSDAGSITSNGVVFKDADGKLKIRLNWNKRYITLAGISTIIGLAFRLRDPENLLGQGEDVGITCALIPSNTPGVVIGRRHDPLSTPFHNCPTQGKDVVVGIDAVIGEVDGCGKGWGMLMECLAAGRGISLPAQSTGGAKFLSRVVSSYTTVRKQFGVSIGKFEAIEEPMARIGGTAYALEAMRKFTLGALDKGIKPPVITALQKYYSTEFSRKCINDAVDILGGAAISMGPRNLVGEAYIATPIGITVEGANIMTRTLIIFGQGALRAHPYAYSEVKAVEANDVKAFDNAFWGHVGHIIRNLCRSILLSVTRGYIASAPDTTSELKVYYRRLQWISATYAILSDVAMGVLGGQLKAKGKITGRFADILAHMYIMTSVLRRYEAEGRIQADLPFVHYTLKNSLSEIQKAFDGIFDNLKIPGIRWFFKGWIGAWSRINSVGSHASDGWSHAISQLMTNDYAVRDRLTSGVYIPQDRKQQMGLLEYAFQLVHQSEAIEKKVRKAVRAGQVPKKKGGLAWDEARKANVITEEEYRLVQETEQVRYEAILVDDFSEEQYRARDVIA